ncbi:hypothetical protein M9H77_01687 [Catharanthus roseus]|uniref:Uncharacterized protein n=1 Tax=Catharanthus roseus TaxID=4058 RepID=A0ACC0C6E2_CATRO|nr:hypothetical protein M9H77_01687 [Catharanthus roseus]
MLGSVTLDLDPVDRGRSTVGGLGPKRKLDQEGPTGWGSTGRPGTYARARYLFMYTLCEVEKSNARTMYLEFRLVSWQRQCVLIRSDFQATPEPFRKFIFCIKVLKALTLLG